MLKSNNDKTKEKGKTVNVKGHRRDTLDMHSSWFQPWIYIFLNNSFIIKKLVVMAIAGESSNNGFQSVWIAWTVCPCLICCSRQVQNISYASCDGCLSHTPELRSRPGLNARLLTVGESLSQQMVLETLVLKFPSNLNTNTQTGIVWEICWWKNSVSFSQHQQIYYCTAFISNKTKLTGLCIPPILR